MRTVAWLAYSETYSELNLLRTVACLAYSDTLSYVREVKLVAQDHLAGKCWLESALQPRSSDFGTQCLSTTIFRSVQFLSWDHLHLIVLSFVE